MAFDDFRDRCRGRWRSILVQLGVSQASLSGRDAPCPVCRGKDRFRFDDRDGRGTWFCRHCGGRDGNGGAGDGIALVMGVRGVNFIGAKQLIEEVVGFAQVSKPSRDRSMSEDGRRALKWLWDNSPPLKGDEPASWYLASRSIGALPSGEAVRFVQSMRDTDRNRSIVTYRPAMLARFLSPTGDGEAMHATFLTPEGGKADTWQVKRFAAGAVVPTGGAVRLAQVSDAGEGVLGIAEGIETAMSAAELFEIPVWAALTSGGLLRFVPPPEVTRLVIFADRDHNFEGQMTAYSLGRKLADKRPHLAVSIEAPSDAKDWNDVLRAKKATAALGPNVVMMK